MTVRIIPNSIDLILGRQTLKKYNFFFLTPFGIIDLPERYKILESAKVDIVDTPDKNRRTSSSHSGKSTGSEHMLSPERVMTHSVEGCDSQFSDCTSESNLGGVSNPTYTLLHIG